MRIKKISSKNGFTGTNEIMIHKDLFATVIFVDEQQIILTSQSVNCNLILLVYSLKLPYHHSLSYPESSHSAE